MHNETKFTAKLIPVKVPNFISYELGTQKITLPVCDLTDEQLQDVIDRFTEDIRKRSKEDITIIAKRGE